MNGPKDLNIIAKPQQWDTAFDSVMNRETVQRLLAIPPFRSMSAENFPEKTPLEGILLNETRLHKLTEGGIVVRQGDYGSSAFLLLSGAAKMVFDIDDKVLGRTSQKRKSFAQAFSQLWKNSNLPEVRSLASYTNRQSSTTPVSSEGAYLQDFVNIVNNHKNVRLKAGSMFGEISALARSQRTATIVADCDCEILEIRWQGLRDLMRYSKELRTNVNKLYRERSLTGHLSSLDLFKGLSQEAIKNIAAHTQFETHGKFDWHVTFKAAKNKDSADLSATEPVVIKEGEYADDLLLIRSGFARVSQKYNNGNHTISYLTRGDVFELDTILKNCSGSEHQPYRYTLKALGYLDILRIPSIIVKQYIAPNISKKHATSGASDKDAALNGLDMASMEETDLMNFFVENRFINGTKTMLINLEKCVGCDDCVTACANAHNNNPRFIRHGERHGKYMVANACMHCSDPVCMIGCPTGAIHRLKSGEVIINDITCIGCATCANSCPYSNIRMVNVRADEGTLLLDEKFSPIVKATKCDLCHDQLVSPACEYACPHDALKRIDIRDLDKISGWKS